MALFSVRLSFTASEISDDAIDDLVDRLAGHGVGVSYGGEDDTVSVRVNVEAGDAVAAVAAARKIVTRAVRTALGVVPAFVEASAVDVAVLDAQLAVSNALVTSGDVAEMVGVSRQRARAIIAFDDFPDPLVVLRTGPVWRAGDVEAYATDYLQRPHVKAKRA
jgi:hypothetical protein